MFVPRVICLGGSATIDQIFYIDAMPRVASAKISANDFVITGGGVAANAAVAVQRLGGEAAYWGRVGKDSWGDQVMLMLAKEGVNIQFLQQLPNYRTKVSSVLVDARGERFVVSAQPQGYPDVTDWLPLSRVGLAHGVLADTRWFGGALALLSEAAHWQLPAVLDGDSGEEAMVRQLMAAATHPVLSEPMLCKLAGEGACSSEEAIRRALLACVAPRNRLVGVTLGERGVWWWEGGGIHHCPALPVKVVDTLAAGDTWHGAFVLALAQGQGGGDAIAFASKVAAIKCTRRGGRLGIPSLKDVEAFSA